MRRLCDEHAALEGALITECDLSAHWHSVFFGEPAQLFGWVCDEGGSCHDTLRGYMTASIRARTRSVKPHIYLDCIYLQPELRRSGIGRAMFTVLEQFARRSGCQEIQWQTLLSNEIGSAFYHSLGAVPIMDLMRWKLPIS
ncbi:N-acetyltransferase family protein [Mesorhizobium sp. ORM8.1]